MSRLSWFLEDNLATISMAKTLAASLQEDQPRQHRIELGSSATGAPTLLIDGVSVHDNKDPVREAMEHVEGLVSSEKVDLVILFGLGLGYHAEQLERRYDCQVFVYDPCLDALRTTLESRPLNLKRTILFADLPQLADLTVDSLQFNDHRLVVGAIPAYAILFADEFARFRSMVQSCLDNAHILENTVVYRLPKWIDHVMSNIPKAVGCPGLEALSDTFAGKPGIVVAAGPSLARNIEVLRQAEGRALVIGLNTSLPQLAAGGVIPDMVAVVEGLDLTSQFEVPFLDQIVLTPALIAFPEFLRLGARHIVPFGDHSSTASDWLTRAFGSHPIHTGGSVACSAFSILHYLGCDPIILVGQDLAYTGGARYAPGAKFGTQRIEYDAQTNTVVTVERNATLEHIRNSGGLDAEYHLRGEEVEAYGGQGKVVTTKMFSLFRQWFESTAATWAADRVLINATEGGARIAGFEEMTLTQALAQYAIEPVPAKLWMDEALRNAPRRDVRLAVAVLDEDLEKCQRHLQLAQQATAHVDEVISTITAAGFDAATEGLATLRQLEEGLSAIPKEFMALDHFIAAEVARVRAGRHADEDSCVDRQTLNSLRRSQELFRAVEKGAQTLLRKMEDVRQELCRLATSDGQAQGAVR